MIDLVKGIVYKIKTPKLRDGYQFSFSFVFHTERIYDSLIYSRLVSFCEAYERITRKRPLCVVMSPCNFRTKAELELANFSLNDFESRLTDLSRVADIGFHGHFWRKREAFERIENQIVEYNYTLDDEILIENQFSFDYSWLSRLEIVKPLYSAGWWFLNSFLLRSLFNEKIQADFSFSFLKWINSTWSKNFMSTNKIKFGESFSIIDKEGHILHCIQTVMGCPNTKFPQDFVRIINSYLDSNTNPCGVIATHDFNLDGNNLEYAIDLILYLNKLQNVEFFSADELISRDLSNRRKCQLYG